MKNVAFKVMGNLLVSVHGDSAMTDAECDACLGFLKTVDLSALRVLVVTNGGAPTPTQRKRFNDALGGHELVTAIVSDVMMVRGVVTAMGWFNKKVRSFTLSEFNEAFRYLDVPQIQHARLRAEVQQLENSLRASAPSPVRRAQGT